jgi:hypothetical protein
MSHDDERRIWRIERENGAIEAVMVSCCTGAELQIRRALPNGEILLRELYPTKSDLYERAADLKIEYERAQAALGGQP